MASLIQRIEAWPGTSELPSHHKRLFGGASRASSPMLSEAAARQRTREANRQMADRRSHEKVKLSSSLRAPSARKSFMMASAQPQRQPTYSHRPTVGPELGPGTHEADLRGDMRVREPARASPVFRSGKLMPLGPKRAADPLGGVSGSVGVPDLLTTQREKVPDLASVSFVSCVERFDDAEMLRRLRLGQVRLPPPASAFPYDPGLAAKTPSWDWDDAVPEE